MNAEAILKNIEILEIFIRRNFMSKNIEKVINKDLSESARILRSKSSTAEERKRAAIMLGSKGGIRFKESQTGENGNTAKNDNTK